MEAVLGSLNLSGNKNASPGPCTMFVVFCSTEAQTPVFQDTRCQAPFNFLKTQIFYRLSQLFRKPLTGDKLSDRGFQGLAGWQAGRQAGTDSLKLNLFLLCLSVHIVVQIVKRFSTQIQRTHISFPVSPSQL